MEPVSRRTSADARSPADAASARRLTWGLAALALLMRLPIVRWGLPEVEEEALPVHKAFDMWGWDQGRLALDPQTAGWPALSFYIQLAVQHVQYGIGRMTGRYRDSLDFFVQHVDLDGLVTPARLVSVFAGVGIVVVGVRIARRLAGWPGALVTGLVLCSSPLLIEQSVRVTPDILLTLFSALALQSLLDVREKGRWRDSVASGAWIGLGVASKYTPVLLVPALVTAHFTGGRSRGRRLAVAGIASVAAFFAASPFTVINLAAARRDIPGQFVHVVTGGHFGHELQGSGPVFYLVHALPAALGWPGLVLGLGGLGLATWRRRGPWLLVAVSFAGYYAGLGALRSLHAHYVLPAVLPVALGLAGLVAELGIERSRRRAVVALALLPLVVLAPLGASDARLYRRYSRPSTTGEAKGFVMRELYRPEACFACELGGPDLPRSPTVELGGRPVLERLDPSDRERLLSRPWVYRYVINLYQTRPHGADLYYDLRHYLLFDYVIVAGSAYHRYRGLAADYPRENEFYDDLQRYCALVRHFPASPDRLGPDVWIYAVGPEARRILDDRGSLAPGFHEPYLTWIRPEDLQSFLSFTGVLATRREDWPTADLYLGTLVDVAPEARPQMLPVLAEVKYRAGDLVGAARLCAEWLRQRPDDSQALALRAAILRRVSEEAGLGEAPDAR